MKLYNDYNSYLKSKYGTKVYRIGLDAEFTCPNRDGTKGTCGCIYCNGTGSRSPYTNPLDSVSTQIETRIKYLKDKHGAGKFVAYFQAFTNTYSGISKLKAIYDSILSFSEIVGLSIGTRPDAVDSEKLELISSYKDNYEVWVEYGLQSSNDNTLRLLNRGHTVKDFTDAVILSKKAGILVSAHVIIGLPGEKREDVIKTAEYLTRLDIDGVKVHPMHVLKGSGLEKLYNEKKIDMLDEDEYSGLVADFLENLSGRVIVQRLTGQGSREDHIAPAWALDKTHTLKMIEEELKRRGSCQGIKVK